MRRGLAATAVTLFAGSGFMMLGTGTAAAETTGRVEIRSAAAKDGTYEVRYATLSATAVCSNATTNSWKIDWTLDIEHDGDVVAIVSADPTITGQIATGATIPPGSTGNASTRSVGTSQHTGTDAVTGRIRARLLPDGTGPAFQDARFSLPVAAPCAQVAGSAVVATAAPAVVEPIPNAGPPRAEAWLLGALAALGIGSSMRAMSVVTTRRRSRRSL